MTCRSDREGRPLSWGRGGYADGAHPEPSAHAVAGNGAPLNWNRAEAEKAPRNPSADAVEGNGAIHTLPWTGGVGRVSGRPFHLGPTPGQSRPSDQWGVALYCSRSQ